MRLQIFDSGFNLWLSARDTYDWAHRPNCSWPCSQTSDNRLFVQFDRNGLCDLTMNGKDADMDGTELSAIVADHLRDRLPKEHPCYFVAVGQFESEVQR